MQSRRTVLAAGAVVWRKARSSTPIAAGAVDLLLVHRPKYDDWTFPKGKLDPGELTPITAVREVEEETGVRIRLGVPLTTMTYPLASSPGSDKSVSYWAARVVGGTGAESFVPNREVDAACWIRSCDVRARLTYARDKLVLDAFEDQRAAGAHRSRTLVVLRHAKAVRRTEWFGMDLERPLDGFGEGQARALVPLLDAFGIERAVTSEATRCIATIEPYADRQGGYIVLDRRLDEQHDVSARDAGPTPVFHAIDDLLDRKRPTVVCGHRPVLPWMFDALGVVDPHLKPGQAAVVHHRRGDVFATEIHPV